MYDSYRGNNSSKNTTGWVTNTDKSKPYVIATKPGKTYGSSSSSYRPSYSSGSSSASAAV